MNLNAGDEKFYVACKAIIFVGDKVLVLSENPWKRWEIPGGRISVSDKEASLTGCLKRELEEELGNPIITRAEDAQLLGVYRLSEPSYNNPNVLNSFVFLVYAIYLDQIPKIQLSEEHTEYQWIHEDEVDELSPWRLGFQKIVEEAFILRKMNKDEINFLTKNS